MKVETFANGTDVVALTIEGPAEVLRAMDTGEEFVLWNKEATLRVALSLAEVKQIVAEAINLIQE
jgi:hypothetical protein